MAQEIGIRRPAHMGHIDSLAEELHKRYEHVSSRVSGRYDRLYVAETRTETQRAPQPSYDNLVVSYRGR